MSNKIEKIIIKLTLWNFITLSVLHTWICTYVHIGYVYYVYGHLHLPVNEINFWQKQRINEYGGAQKVQRKCGGVRRKRGWISKNNYIRMRINTQ